MVDARVTGLVTRGRLGTSGVGPASGVVGVHLQLAVRARLWHPLSGWCGYGYPIKHFRQAVQMKKPGERGSAMGQGDYAAQGIPVKVQDSATLRLIAKLLRGK
jgi:hypothetical protein